MKMKTFDCVEMKHVGAEQVQKKTAGMTRKQLLEFWRQRSQALRERQQQIVRQSKEIPVPSTQVSEA